MPAAFADPEDVAGIFRPLSTSEIVLAENLLDDATALILEVPVVPARIESGTLSPDTLRVVAKHMVKRVLQNQQAARSVSFGVDDGQVSRTLDNAVSSGELYISVREMQRLTGKRPRGAAFTISPGPVYQ